MNDLTPETIAELRGLLSPLTTPRPWHVWDRGIGWEVHEGADAECLSEYGCNAEGCEPINNGQRDTFSFPDAELIAAAVNALPALLDAAERLAEVTAERDALSEGRCLADITHRDEEHRQSVCMLPKDHAPLMHDDCMGCTWTDAEHWKASAVDRVANAVASHPDPTCDEYASKGPISCGWKRALIDVRWALADGSGS